MSSRTRRAALSLLLATVGTATLLTPVAAGGTGTRFVDDDGTAGPGGCGGALSVPTSIQAAVDVSAPGDTIKVCPGTYPETVDVDVEGLTIRGVSRWSARLNPTSSTIGAIIRVNADDVRLQWLKVLGRTTGSCQYMGAGILVNGVENAEIISNNVLASPKGDGRSGPCGLFTGIHVATGGSALIRYNIVRDWRVQGIWLQSNDTGSAVKDNSVRYWHPDACLAAASTACTSGAAPAVGTTPIGIHVHNSTAVVSNNAVTSRPDAPIAFSSRMDLGIRVNASTGVVVRGNTIARVYSIGIYTLNATGARIVGNRVTDAVSGIQLTTASTGNTVRGNTLDQFVTHGILATPDSGSNTFIENTVTDATQEDCRDLGSGNTWTDNVGADSSPVGICSPI